MTLRPWLDRARLVIEVGLWRHGWIWPVAGLGWVAAALLAALVLVPAQHDLARLNDDLAQPLPERARPAPPAAAPQGTRLEDVLVPAQETAAQLRQIHRQAARAGLVISESEVRQQVQAGQPWRQVQLSLPTRAAYPQVRRFVEAVLRDQPAVSLDRLSLQRDAVGESTMQVAIRMTLWTRPEPLARPASGADE